MKLPSFIKQFGHIFHKNGYQCYLVGGAIRNIIAGRPTSDFDFATNAEPKEVQRLFKRVIPTGIQHGTVTVLFKGHHLEVTTFRIEGKYSDSRRPDTIEFTPSIYEDLKRRDFTINAIAYNLAEHEIIDPHGGKTDIKKKLIKSIGNPDDRFREDPLRMLRACRFSAQLEFSVDDKTLEGIINNNKLIQNVSMERIRDEFIKIVTSPAPGRGIELMDETGLLHLILPELSATKGVPQKGMHVYDVFNHSIRAMEFAENKLEVRLAALFHDLGKADTIERGEDGQPRFHDHERVSEEKTHALMNRLKFPKYLEKTVSLLVRNHMFSYDNLRSDSAIRRFLARVGKESLEDLFLLRRADSSGIAGKRYACPKLAELEDKIREIESEDHALTVQDLNIDGNTLSEKAGIPKGPEMGKILAFLLEAVLDDPSLNSEDRLIALAENYYETYLRS